MPWNESHTGQNSRAKQLLTNSQWSVSIVKSQTEDKRREWL